MHRALSVVLACLVLEACSIAQQNNNGGVLTGSPLIQIEHLAGDQYAGFTQSCLLVYSDGKYHRETRRQENVDGRARPYWQLPETFESTISAGDLEQLRAIVESENFRAIVGTLGDAGVLRSSLAFWPSGVTPHSDIDIFEASVAHSNSSQVFEVLGPIGREPANSLRSFKKWIAGVEKRKEGRIDTAAADSCSVRTPLTNGSSPWHPSTRLIPGPFYTPGPKYPVEERNAGYSGKVTVQAMINSDGSVGPVSVRRGLNPMLDQCVLDAVRHWKFVPARLNGIAIATTIEVEVHFPPI